MTTQSQAPTDEMRETARSIVDGVDVGGTLDRWLCDAITKALAAQDRLARAEERERCAKWHDEQEQRWSKEQADAEAQEYTDNANEAERHATHHRNSAAAIRAQGEK